MTITPEMGSAAYRIEGAHMVYGPAVDSRQQARLGCTMFVGKMPYGGKGWCVGEARIREDAREIKRFMRPGFPAQELVSRSSGGNSSRSRWSVGRAILLTIGNKNEEFFLFLLHFIVPMESSWEMSNTCKKIERVFSHG